MTGGRRREWNELPWIAGAAIVSFLILVLTACSNTLAAVEQLPAGYAEGTWRLIEGVALDVWAAFEWLVGALL